MPLGERLGTGNDSHLFGLEFGAEFYLFDLSFVDLILGRYDFAVTPLVIPENRTSFEKKYRQGLLPLDSRDRIVCKISSEIDFDSEEEEDRVNSETALKDQIAWASYLSLQACLLPTPNATSFVNYARCVSQILQEQKDMKLWLRIPLGKPDANLIDYWETWNSFRLLCGHHSQLCIALDNLSGLPSENSIKRWFGEPVAAAMIHMDSFLTTHRGKYISKRQQKLITDFFNHSIKIILTGTIGTASDPDEVNRILPCLVPYQQYISFLYKQMEPLPLQECYEFEIRDLLQSPFQPLNELSEALDHKNSKNNQIKYSQYKKAIREALLDRVPDEKASAVTTVLMIVGAGRGLLVRASVKVAEEVGRNIKIYAVDKNIETAVSLNELVCANSWNDLVTIVTTDDVHYWDAPETADILVCELLGSFGDNELAIGFLDGAQRFLKEDGISIPSSYTSFLQPLTASKYYNDVRSSPDILNAETACVVKMHNVARLASCQPVFTFTHPNRNKASNQLHKKLHFVIPDDTGSAMVHGFAGYFDATLYKDVHLENEPSIATPDIGSWYPMFFPLRSPICVHRGSALDVHFWRRSDSTKVWYEWCVTSPSTSPIHNCNGRSYWVSL